VSKPSPGGPTCCRASAQHRPVGVTGSDSANAIAEKADVILAVGTRLQDFTTGSWTAFDAAKIHLAQCRAA
jgi:TPP-dependent trihydroxycyclohexane-1,2-dione (THcHDO) dehydratase